MKEEQAGRRRILLQVNSISFNLDDARIVLESDLEGHLNIQIHPRPIGRQKPIYIETRTLSGLVDSLRKIDDGGVDCHCNIIKRET